MAASKRKEALEKLCVEYRYVMRLIRRMGIDDDDAGDIAGEVFVDAMRGIDGLRDVAKMRAWLRAIAVNRIRRYFRERTECRETSGVMRTGAGETDLLELIVDEDMKTDSPVDAETRMLLMMLVDSLSDPARRVIAMRFWGGYRHSEIAEALGINVNTEKSIYIRSLKRLRERYAEMTGGEK